MSSVFNAEEILEVAVQIERTGAAYYRLAASFAENPAAKNMLEELAEMEDGHEMLFENFRADPDVLSELIGDPDGETALYLRAFSESQVFPEKEEALALLKPDTSLDQILRQGITMELKSIAFYQGIKDAIPDHLGADKVTELIAEERKHVTILSRRLAALRAKKS